MQDSVSVSWKKRGGLPMAKIDAIVSAYYCKDWLENRIEDLLVQTETPSVIAVCQEGSEEYKILSRFPVTIIPTPDIPTVYWAWNKAIRNSVSPYIFIANSDDRLLNHDVLANFANLLDENPEIGLVYADQSVVTEEYGEPIGAYDLRDPEADLLEGCYIGSAPMYRRSLHDQFGMYNEMYQIAGDYDMWIRFQQGGVKFHHIKERLTTFWDRGTNIEFAKRDRLIWENARIRRKWSVK